MKLLRELTEEVELVTEGSGSEKKYFIEGIFIQTEIKNRNNRFYPKGNVEQEVDRYINENVNKKSAYGELNHPNGPTINLDRVSHLIESLTEHGTNFEGKAKIITSNPMGSIVKGILDEGGRLGVSSRGLGTLKKKNGIMEVQSDFRLSTAADIVADPSAPDAYVRGLYEEQDWVLVNGNWQMLEQHHDAITKATSKQIEEMKLSLFEDFLKSIR